MAARSLRQRKTQFIILSIIVIVLIYLASRRQEKYSNWELSKRNIELAIAQSLAEDAGGGCAIPRLDPFAPEVMQFVKHMPPVECHGRDWVECHVDTCRIKPSILSTHATTTCELQDIRHVDDWRYILAPAVRIVGAQEYKLVQSDHVKCKCWGVDVTSNKMRQWRGYALGLRPVPPQPPHSPPQSQPHPPRYSALVIILDSTARNGFIRLLPESWRVLTGVMDAVVLQGYNIIGDGTPMALFPILTGKIELEFPDMRRATGNEVKVDHTEFLFHRLQQEGYRTAYLEDSPEIGTFQYRLNGFTAPPAHHYLRSLLREDNAHGKSWRTDAKEPYCFGDTPLYEVMLNITKQFMSIPGPKFGVTFIADISHDDFNRAATADGALARTLTELRDAGHLSDTAVIVCGDHGPRYNKVRNTLQGRLEERMPLMALMLPERMRRERPDAWKNLKANAHVLTTPRDIHATLRDVTGLEAKRGGSEAERGASGASTKLRALSLLEPIPATRSCGEAGVEPHWCVCLRWSNVSAADPLRAAAAARLLAFINDATAPYREACARRSLRAVLWARRGAADRRLLSFAGAADADGYEPDLRGRMQADRENVMIKISVSPGEGVFEASMVHVKKDNTFILKGQDISRTNMYHDEPKCISSIVPALNPYCYCNENLGSNN